jgi:hypothetical protein
VHGARRSRCSHRQGHLNAWLSLPHELDRPAGQKKKNPNRRVRRDPRPLPPDDACGGRDRRHGRTRLRSRVRRVRGPPASLHKRGRKHRPHEFPDACCPQCACAAGEGVAELAYDPLRPERLGAGDPAGSSVNAAPSRAASPRHASQRVGLLERPPQVGVDDRVDVAGLVAAGTSNSRQWRTRVTARRRSTTRSVPTIDALPVTPVPLRGHAGPASRRSASPPTSVRGRPVVGRRRTSAVGVTSAPGRIGSSACSVVHLARARIAWSADAPSRRRRARSGCR